MPPHRQSRAPFAHVSPEVLERAFHPFDKLVIGLPPAMASWVRAYGPASEWVALPANPLMQSARRAPTDGSGEAPSASSDVPPPASSSHAANTPRSQPPSQRPPTRPFRCDACDRDFATAEKHEAHMQTHMYCTVPGCHFTCRENRAHQMQEHMDALHNRPDAPNLVDTSAYLEQRKRRFPTQEVIKDKVEELYYKAARGVVLPDERRRWLRQYGIDVGKRARTEASYIARGSLPENSRSPSAQSEASENDSGKSSQSSGSRRGGGNSSHNRSRRRSPPVSRLPNDVSQAGAPPPVENREVSARPRFIQPPPQTPHATLEDPTAPPSTTALQPSSRSPSSPPPPSAAASSFSSKPQPPSASSATPHHPKKIIPLGPNGTLTPRQRVQLVRERYASAKEVPQFYVCHRCGTKGEHWVDDCPTKGDTTYNRHVVWGEAKMEFGEGGKPKGGQRDRPDRNRDAPKEGNALQPMQNQHQEQPGVAEGVNEKAGENAEENIGGVGRQDLPQSAISQGLQITECTHQTEPSTEISNTNNCDRENVSSQNVDNKDDDAPPTPQSAAPPADAPKELTRVMAPVAAAKYACPNRRDPLRRPPPPPTLYERLTEEERLTEQGLLLQAMRFFTAREFFQDRK